MVDPFPLRPVAQYLRSLRYAWLVLLILAGSTPAPAAPPPVPLPDFSFHPVLPVTQAAAAATAMKLTPLVIAEERVGLRAGDGLTALVTWTEGKAIKQWLVQVQATELNDKESKLPPARGMLLYSSTGHEFRFAGSRAALALRVLGPFEDGKPASRESREGKKARVLTQAEYLGLGLDRACQVMLKLQAMRTQPRPDNPLPAEQQSLGFGNRPFPPEVVAAAQKRAVQFGLTQEDERALVGSLPALLEFFSIVSRTPGLQDILKSVIDLPWWSILKSGGKMPDIGIDFVTPSIRPLAPEPWSLSSLTPYAFPIVITLNKSPALVCHLAVVSPRPPLIAAAGVVGLAAARPDGKGPRVMIQVIAAHPAPEAPVPSQ